MRFLISSIGSNQGKTLLTTALLNHYKDSVRPFKIGPDYIDPQFHEKVCGTSSVNLDRFMMNDEQLKWLFNRYNDKRMAIVEGVMGYYDGMDKGSSAYDVSILLDIPTLLILDGSGSYITISAVLHGMLNYKEDSNIKAVVLNRISSEHHFQLIKERIEQDHADLKVLGWIPKDLRSINDTHLGLDLEDIEKIEEISKDILEHIDLEKLESIPSRDLKEVPYPFEKYSFDKKLAIIKDKNFSFLYHDNVEFFKDSFKEVIFLDSTKDEVIDESVDCIYLPGGYVETEEAYNRIKDFRNFKNSLIKHSETKPVYGECAGLLYLSRSVDEKEMAGIIDEEFTLENKRTRLGYYYNEQGMKGHAFHYTKPKNLENGFNILSKKIGGKGSVGSWQKGKVYGTYLHTMFRGNFQYLKEYFGV
ncbi:MAG: cobyrinate a,c-diamide synthase [Campylobacterales bacterium]|nr:cobyrinate a,c-diamide synthase [Campylobacterales bacterium]